MAVFNEEGKLTLDAGEALSRYRRVKLDGSNSRQVVYADAGDAGIGVVEDATASGDPAMIRLDGYGGTIPAVAAGAITINSLVYPAADGKVSSTASGAAIGRTLIAASGDGSVIEILPDASARFSDEALKIKLFDDFLSYVATGDAAEATWTATATDSGTATLGDAVGGELALAPSDGTVADNDEIYFHTTNELFKFADSKPLWFEARVKVTEANTDDANVLVGLMDGVAANALVDNGAGPKASYSGAVFYKVDGGTAWLAEVSDSTTQTAVTLTGGTLSSGSYVKLGIEFVPTAANTASVFFYIDGTLAGSTTGFDYSNATELDVVVGAKNGGANNEAVVIDYIHCQQLR